MIDLVTEDKDQSVDNVKSLPIYIKEEVRKDIGAYLLNFREREEEFFPHYKKKDSLEDEIFIERKRDTHLKKVIKYPEYSEMSVSGSKENVEKITQIYYNSLDKELWLEDSKNLKFLLK